MASWSCQNQAGDVRDCHHVSGLLEKSHPIAKKAILKKKGLKLLVVGDHCVTFL
jgi:hypothetical protein